jgi:acyl dehydratase
MALVSVRSNLMKVVVLRQAKEGRRMAAEAALGINTGEWLCFYAPGAGIRISVEVAWAQKIGALKCLICVHYSFCIV